MTDNPLKKPAIKTARDITKRKPAEETLKQRERKYKALIDTTGTGYVILDGNGKVLDANPEYVRLTGHRSFDEIAGRSVVEWTAPHHREKNSIQVKKCIEKGFVRNLEIDYIDQTGHITPIEINATLLEGNEGHHILSIVRDITSRKRAEEALRISEARYRSLVEDQTELVCRFAPDGTFIFVNDVYCNFFGKSKDELIGGKWLPLPVDEDLTFIQEKLRTLSPANPIVIIENRVLSSKGDIYWIQFVNRGFFDLHGNLLEIQSVGRDITERKKAEDDLQNSEKRFRALIEHSHDAITLLTADGTVLYDSPSIVRVLGYSPTERIGRSVFEFVHPKERRKIAHGFAKFVRQPGAVDPSEVRFLHKDGKLRRIEGTRTNLLHESTVRAVVVNYRDITERKKAEKILQEKERELEIKAKNLEEANIALKVLLRRTDEDRAELEEKVLLNVRDLVIPYLEKLKIGRMDETQRTFVNILEANLIQIISPFSHSMSSKFLNFTPTEIQVADLLRKNKTSKEIGELLNASPRSITFHRENIRKKLGLKNKKANLKSYLLSLK